jgi:hypothetical protein
MITSFSYIFKGTGGPMKKVILGISILIISSHVFATTAVLCGDSAKVDQDNKFASVHLVLDQEESRTPNEISAAFYGKESKVASVSEKQARVYIQTLKPARLVVLDKKSIESLSCDGESAFSIQVVQSGITSAVNDCRCFAD